MTLTETAAGIREYLKRFAADETIAVHKWIDGQGRERSAAKYFKPMAWRSGNRCKIKYVTYQYEYSLTKAEAETYLSWLSVGNVGTHKKALAEPTLSLPPGGEMGGHGRGR